MAQTPLPPDQNPFASPQATPATAVPEHEREGLLLASQWQRLGNLIVDGIVLRIFAVFVGIAVGIFLGIVSPETLDAVAQEELSGLDLLLGLGAHVIFFAFFEGVFKRTPGKWITGTRVVTVNGAEPTFGQILARTFVRLIPFEPFSFLGSNHPAGWHDRWTGTRVIRVRG